MPLGRTDGTGWLPRRAQLLSDSDNIIFHSSARELNTKGSVERRPLGRRGD